MNPPRKTSSPRSHEKETSPVSLDYDHLSRLCLKYWKLLAGGLVLGLVGGYLFAASQTAIYSARSTIIVNEKSSTGSTVDDGGQQTDLSGDMIKTYEQMLQTKDLAQRVVKNLHLNENPEFLPPGVAAPVSEDEAAGILAGEVTIRIRPLTRLIDISVEHHSPKMAELLANSLAEESIEQRRDQTSSGSGELSDYFDKEVDRLRKKVTESEDALAAYQASHGIPGSIDNPQDVGATQLKDLNQQYMEAQARVTLLKERYLENHPKLIEAEATLSSLKNELDKAQAQDDGKGTVGYNSLKADVESYRTQLNLILKERNGAETSQRVVLPGIAVEEQATLPYVPVRPNKTKTAAVGGFFGLVCGLGFVLALYFMDSSLRTVSQAESTLNVPVIAAVPILTESDGRSVLPTFSDPQSFVAESIRGLRAALILHDRENPLKTILMASAIPGEGKSFCAANLAVAFAQAGLKTLLIDADLRLPTIHTYFNLPPNEEYSGFPAVLEGRGTLASAVLTSQIPTLDLLLTTIPSSSPAESLSGSRLPQLLDQAAANYDRVIIDSAPLNAVSDTMLIMQKADAILLVVRASQTPAGESKSALQKIYSSKMKPLGLILNYLDPRTLKSYSYGYSYGQKPKEKNAK